MPNLKKIKTNASNLFSGGNKNITNKKGSKDKYRLDIEDIDQAEDDIQSNDNKPEVNKENIAAYFAAYNKLRVDYVKSDIEDNMYILDKLFSDNMIEKIENTAKEIAQERGLNLDEINLENLINERTLVPDERSFVSLNNYPKLIRYLVLLRKIELILRENNISPMQLIEYINEVQSLGFDFATLFKKATGVGANAAPGQPSAARIVNSMGQFINACSALTASVISFVKADNLLKIDRWVETKLVNRLMMINKINELKAIQSTTFRSKKELSDDELDSLEKVIFPKNLAEAKAMSPNDYRDLLEKEMWVDDGGRLAAFLKDEKSAMNLFLQLELHHLNRKLAEGENKIMLRLSTNVNKMEESTKNIIKQHVNHYVYDNLELKQKMSNVLRQNHFTCSPKMLKEEDKIVESLEAKKIKKVRDMRGRGFLLLTVGLGVASILTGLFVPPPAGLAISITLAAVALVTLAIAKRYKPNIVKDVTGGFKSFKNKATKEYNFWTTKVHAENLGKYRDEAAKDVINTLEAAKSTPKS